MTDSCGLKDNTNSLKSKTCSSNCEQKKANDRALSDEQGFLALQKRILRERGFDLSQYREKCLKRRINVRLRATGAHTYLDYMTVLKKDPTEYDRLFDTLTINVTNFFRDKSTYRVIEGTIIPELILLKKKQGKKIIRIWSAGCASGEEPYSIAILFHQVLGAKINDFLISIHATDIDEPSLEKAKRAEYEASAFSEVDERILRRYFNYNLEFSLKEEINQMVRFKWHDLISDRPLANLDIILCRNVLIYFSRDLQVKLCTKFYQCLNRGGYLILGKTESLSGESTRLFQPVSTRERVYQKKSRGAF
jgi:chemotaxis protein methyltransferase CheR